MLTLGSALAAWVEPSMLGGGFVNLLSNSVESAFTGLRYPVVAALSTFVIALLAVLLVILMLVARRFGDLSSTFRVLKAGRWRSRTVRRPPRLREGGGTGDTGRAGRGWPNGAASCSSA